MAVIAVDCGGTNLLCARAESPGRLGERRSRATPRRAAVIPATVVAAAGPLVDDSVGAVGIGSAGLVDSATGVLVWSPHSAGRNVPLGPQVEAALGRPVVVDNDNSLAARAEARLGAGRGYRMVLFVGVGTGIGAGLALDGRLERGRGFLGEVGHMCLDPAGPPCPCGRRGCWEALVSGAALGREARRIAGADPGGMVARLAAGRAPRGEHLTAAAEAGDPAAAAALAGAGEWLGRGLANLIAALDPDVVVLGGGAGAALLGGARAAIAASLSGARYRDPTPILPAHFGVDAGLVGAALAAEERTW